MSRRRYPSPIDAVVTGWVIVLTVGMLQQAQIPGIPASGPPASASTAAPKKSVVTAEGPIKVKENISDRTIQQFLAEVPAEVSRRDQRETLRSTTAW